MVGGVTGSPLPADLLAFTAARAEKAITLKWQTGNEANLSHFEVERSTNGNRFETIGKQTAQNTPSGSYTFLDAQAPEATAYYRLATVEQNGQRSLSATVQVKGAALSANANLQVVPNPVAAEGFQLFHPAATGQATIRIVNSLGQLVHTVRVAEGSTATSFKGLNLAAGNYHLSFEDGATRLSSTFVK